jgi:integrase
MGRRRKAWLANGTGRRQGRPGFYVLWNDYAPDGRQVRRSKHFLTAQLAREYCRRTNAKRDLSEVGAVIPISIKDAGREFTEGLAARAPETVRGYSVTISQCIATLGPIDVCAIDRLKIDQFVAAKLHDASEATAAKHVRNLRCFFKWCVKNSYHDVNPIDLATSLPRQGTVRHKPQVTAEQFTKLIAALDTEDRRLAVQIAATTGLDRGVIARLTAQDVDLPSRQFRTVRTKVGKMVHPFIHDDIFPQLGPRIDRTPPGRPLLSGLSHQGGADDWWKRAARSAGLPHLTFRDLRTFAVNWLRSILGDFEAQRIVGHSTPAVTSKHYYQVNPQAQKLLSQQPLPGSPSRRRARKTG